ncbi:MAG: biotin--[acetyl-CoA-carboxylase] ligase [Microthrixaceae bacterium]
MELRQTREALPLVRVLGSAESTNAVLRQMVSARASESGGEDARLPHGTLVATGNQTAGRGRQGRGWETPADTAVAASMLLRLSGGADALPASWLPLLAGSAVVAALQPLFGGAVGESKRVGVKWPNDVHVRDEYDAMAGRPGAKLCGILCEALPSGEVIVGFGVNLLQQDWQLPTERAGSVLACGGETGGAETLADPRGEALADRVLAGATAELLVLVALAAEQPEVARRRVLRDSVTLGSEVRVHLPGDETVDGRAVGLAADGSLIVDRPTSGQLIVSAADVEHLR